MNRVETTAKVRVYENDGEEISIEKDDQFLTVTTHWNESSKVLINVGGAVVTVVAVDLIKAIERCSE